MKLDQEFFKEDDKDFLKFIMDENWKKQSILAMHKNDIGI